MNLILKFADVIVSEGDVESERDDEREGLLVRLIAIVSIAAASSNK